MPLTLDDVIYELGLINDRVTVQNSTIQALNRENRILRQDVEVLQKKNNELEGQIEELKEDVKTNRSNILKLERRTLVNEAHDRLRHKFSFTQDQLNPINYEGKKKLRAAAKFVLKNLPPTEQSKLSLHAVKLILNRSENSVRMLGNKLAHTSATTTALEDQNLEASQRDSLVMIWKWMHESV